MAAGAILRTIDVYIRRFGKALDKGGQSDLIRTARRVGYVLERIVQ